jgi:hypothetical protein
MASLLMIRIIHIARYLLQYATALSRHAIDFTSAAHTQGYKFPPAKADFALALVFISFRLLLPLQQFLAISAPLLLLASYRSARTSGPYPMRFF